MKFEEKLKGSEDILILAHHNADIDAVASGIALYEFLVGDVALGVPDTVSKGAKELAGGYEFLKNPDLENFKTLLIVDCPSTDQLGSADIRSFEGTIMLIDHHSPGDLYEFADFKYTDSKARSTAELVYELFEDEPNKKASEAMICGMVADTSHLRFADEKQFRYISELLPKSGKSYSDILSTLSTPVDRSERIARLKAASRLDNYDIGGKLVSFSEVGSFEAASARSFLKLGSDVSVVFSKRGEEMRVSGRCRRGLTDKVHLGEDVFSELEEELQGSAGGHDAAASGNGTNTDLREVKEAFLERFEEVFDAKAKEL
ncbi:MAG: DHH family phosphoesterase [Candidatus Aenigmatarchaeota archaeon]